MKVSLNWLKEYVDIEMSPDDLAELLTMIGLEVEGLEAVGQSLGDILVARILTARPHPVADRLYLCDVDIGNDTVQVVCGAPNVEEGALAPFALPGVRLPDGTLIKEDKIRGEISKGMLLAEDEMGLTDDHEGIMILPPDLTPGDSLQAVCPLSDWILDVSLTPNRPDCASVIGIAREIAALTGKRLERPETEVKEDGPDIEELTSVTIVDPVGCPRYAAGIIQDVQLGPSPFWMRYRLYLSEIRSINNIVDVTNYVLLEMGQPLHAFDYNRLRENRIVVRRAEEGEAFATLDGQSHSMSDETLMICDGERPVALAGIMGGLNSEIFGGTRHVLVESAFFDPVTIRRGSKRLGLSTEASYRFERGVDIEGVTTALKRSLLLISRLAGGKIAKGLVDNYPNTYSRPVIDLGVDKTNRFLGTSASKDEISGYLKALEMEVHDVDNNALRVKPPSFRVDITRQVDLIEEVARLIGFDKIPVTYPSIRPSEEGEAPELTLRDQTRSIMVGLGFTEIITYSFITPDSADMLNADKESPLRSFVELLNPLTVDQSVMRTSLIPGLLSTVKTNILHNDEDLKLFEWGRVFIRKEGAQQPVEKTSLTAVMTGLYSQRAWYTGESSVDFYDIKGAIEALLKGLGLEGITFRKGTGLPWYDTDFSSAISLAGAVIGQVGRVSSGVLEAYELEGENVYLFELDIGLLLQNLKGARKFLPFPKFPAVYRDISIVVRRELESAKINEIIRREGGNLVESVHIFDLYEGKNIDPSEKAIAFRICYRSEQETLDGLEVNRLHDSIIESIRKETGGRLREG
ncbi:MAG: phenylalanine--tRNA ligase subunit beta [Desulfatiglandaceae bacterium]